MPAEFTKTDIERVAALARLRLTEDEKRLFGQQLASILRYAEQVRELDTGGVAATSHVLSPAEPCSDVRGRHPADRPDEIRPSLPVADALANAPAQAPGGLFTVPRVITG
jgi:aspartyl-tRNA(Asn)/glutamyl-tRNA(Gln) amidotransferase subunit C